MSVRKISELPKTDLTQFLSECERNGSDELIRLGVYGMDVHAVFLFGVAESVLDLRRRIEKLESKT